MSNTSVDASRQLTSKVRSWLRDVAVKNGFFVTGAEWSIAVGSFSSLEDLGRLADAQPTLSCTDIVGLSARFVADPFLFRWQNRLYLFMEVLDTSSGKGVIGWAELCDDNIWRFRGIALDLPFHLSYPHVFESNGEIYMIPETSAEESVQLYRASQFPVTWEYCATLLEGAPFSDASLLKHDGLWWMFVEASSGPHFDTLRLFSSADPRGPWTEHNRSPIVKGDAQSARPAGPPVRLDGKLIRFAQDCREVYGRAVFGFEVVCLGPDVYEERPIGEGPLLSERGSGWNGQAMHHVSVLQEGDQWLAAVDGRPMPGFRLPKLPRLGWGRLSGT